MKNQKISTLLISALVGFGFYLIGVFTGTSIVDTPIGESRSSRIFHRGELSNYSFRLAEEDSSCQLHGYYLDGIRAPSFDSGEYVKEGKMQAWVVDLLPKKERAGRVIIKPDGQDDFLFLSGVIGRRVSIYSEKTCYFINVPKDSTGTYHIESKSGVLSIYTGNKVHVAPANSVIYVNADQNGMVIGVAQQEEYDILMQR